MLLRCALKRIQALSAPLLGTLKNAILYGRCFWLFPCTCASCWNGVQFFISDLARWLALAALASLLSDPPEPEIIGKHYVSRLSYLFAGLEFLSSEFLSFDLLSSSLLFSSLLFSDSSHLFFSSVNRVGILTSKLSSITFQSYKTCNAKKTCKTYKIYKTCKTCLTHT